ncbi:MAG TPA: hypothetical protein VFW24_01835, partial [Acidimicrobiales bacterium]|nr:hypothetical protein [Acidimicrobiales bacterium]
MDSDNEDPTRGGDPEEPGPAEEPRTRTEGVRIIGADEAAAALDSGQAAGRRPEDAPRYGDVPVPPTAAASPPAARFPLPDAMDPAEVPRPPLAGGPRAGDLPHWTEPPTGEVPAVLAGAEVDEDDLSAWSGLNRPGARWRDHPRDWDDAHFEDAADLAAMAPSEGDPAEDYYDLTRTGADLPEDRADEVPAEPAAPPPRRLWRRPPTR